ncbi:MAG: hypothetical protein WC473_02760 [Patescibacteria group bacterium]
MFIEYCLAYLVPLIALSSYLLIGCASHFSVFMPAGTALNDNYHSLTRWERIIYTLAWPVYFSIDRVGQRLSFMARAVSCIIIMVIILDLTQWKIASLDPSQIEQTSLATDPQLNEVQKIINDLSIIYTDWDKIAMASLGKNQEASVIMPEHILAPSAEQIAATVHHPLQARTIVFCYQLQNGLIADNSPPSFSQIHYSRRPLDDYGAAVVAAYVLKHCGYEPYILCLKTSWKTFLFRPLKSSITKVYLYKQDGKFGYISLLGISEPKFSTIKELARELSKKMQVNYTQYFLFDLNVACPGWERHNPGIRGCEIWRNL